MILTLQWESIWSQCQTCVDVWSDCFCARYRWFLCSRRSTVRIHPMRFLLFDFFTSLMIVLAESFNLISASITSDVALYLHGQYHVFSIEWVDLRSYLFMASAVRYPSLLKFDTASCVIGWDSHDQLQPQFHDQVVYQNHSHRDDFGWNSILQWASIISKISESTFYPESSVYLRVHQKSFHI